MLKTERQTRILKEIDLHNKVLSTDLSSLLNVSEDTIRRDLHELSENGKVLKVHGGALSKSFGYVNGHSEFYAQTEKEVIAQKIAALIKDGMFVLTSGGTTLRTMAKMLPKDLKATFFTISPLMALELSKHPNLEVIMLGGKLHADSQICVGGEVINKLNDMRVDLCLIGVNAIDFRMGLTDSDPEVIQTKRAMRKASKELAIATISEKLGTTQYLKIFDLSEIDYLITERNADDEAFESYKHRGLTVL
jgi:DeoR/GlpR family transcriptional regulator of sugar metabolism